MQSMIKHGGSGRGAMFSSLASLASLVASLSCCLPLGTLFLAAGSAGASLFIERLRPWLLVISAVSLVFAFVQTYFRNRCEFRYRRVRTCLLWFSATVLIAMAAGPQTFATLLAGRLPTFIAAHQLQTFDSTEFLRLFDATSGDTRLVLLLSPT